MKFTPARLVLKDGSMFSGYTAAGTTRPAFGEVVFTTGMTGYVESLTDPSYAGQILVFTYPLVGNYGVPKAARWESKKIHVRGVVMSEACEHWSHHEGMTSLLDWLDKQGVPSLVGIDTRAITKLLRETGVMLGAIAPRMTRHELRIKDFSDPNTRNLVADVSPSKRKTYGNGKKTIIVVDCGMKENIVRQLREFPVTIHRVPYDYDYSNERFDGILLSNGPGDPTRCGETIAILKKAMRKKKPTFGICLGTQIMALAAGAKTYKLPYGHRGQNQPCRDEESGRCYLTSQNHGYAIKEDTLPRGWRVSLRNLNDGSVEGIAHTALPFFSVQFHPEAAPGPTDSAWLFQKFYDLL